MKYIVSFFVTIFSYSMIPVIALAQGGFVPCGGGQDDPCQMCHFIQMGNSIMMWFVVVLIVLGVFVFAFAGLKLITSGGNTNAKDAAKDMFVNVIVGYLLVLSAWLIVDTLMKVLTNDNIGGLGPWNEMRCVSQPAIASGRWDVVVPALPGSPVGSFGGVAAPAQPGGNFGPDSGVGDQGSCEVASSGPCSPDALVQAGFSPSMASQASQIAGAESGCGTNAESRTDTTTDGRTFSVGTWQINLAVHPLNCTNSQGQSINLNCPSAFQNAGTRNRFNVREYNVVNESLYQQCVQAAKDPRCNNEIASGLANRSGDLGDWACSAKKCNIGTSRNHLCPL